MIALPEQRALILTPPKTAASTLHRLFCEAGGPGMWIYGLNAAGLADKHASTKPAEFAEFTLLLSVRNPYDRAVSLYNHLCRWRAYNGYAAPSFVDFAQRLASGDAYHDGYLFTATIDQMAGDDPPRLLLRTEHLAEDLLVAGLIGETTQVPHSNAAYRRPWRDYYAADRVAADAVAHWGRIDFVRFGYDAELPGTD